MLAAAVSVDVAIGLAHLVNMAGLPVIDRSIQLFDLDAEHNLPTWWSSIKLFLIGAVFLLAAPRVAAVRRSQLFVVVAAAVFAFLSLDEFAAIHEELGRRTRMDALPVTGIWPFVYGALGLAAAGLLAVIGRSFMRSDRIGAICFVGGLVAYVIAAAALDLTVNIDDLGSMARGSLIFVEEMGELLAASVMLYGAWRLVEPVASRPETPSG